MKGAVVTQGLLLLVAVLYPVGVYFGLKVMPPSFFGLVLIVVLALRWSDLPDRAKPAWWACVGVLVSVGVLSTATAVRPPTTSVMATVASVLPAFLTGALGVQLRDELDFDATGLGFAVAAFFMVGVLGSALLEVIERSDRVTLHAYP